MPAYSVSIRRDCRQPSCTSAATYEVFNTRNASQGFYCARHRQAAVDDLDALTTALDQLPAGDHDAALAQRTTPDSGEAHDG